MKIAIYVGKREDVELARLIARELRNRGVEAFAIRREDADSLGIPLLYNDGVPDAIIITGGDGTIFRFLHERFDLIDTPILHVGTGRLNFFADATANEALRVIDKLVKGEYFIDERITLEAEFEGLKCVVLNEVLVKSPSHGRLVRFTVIDGSGEPLLDGRMDGVIIATPTGSTAYALSAGGPVLDLRLKAKVIVPLAPFSRLAIPVVHPYEIPLKVTCERKAFIVCDGIFDAISDEVFIRPCERRVKFIRTKRYSLYERLPQRLVTT